MGVLLLSGETQNYISVQKERSRLRNRSCEASHKTRKGQHESELDMGAEANILPVRTYNKMFPDRVLEDGTPDPKYLQPTHIEFE